jgi:hypothetical protein
MSPQTAQNAKKTEAARLALELRAFAFWAFWILVRAGRVRAGGVLLLLHWQDLQFPSDQHGIRGASA